MEFDPDGQRLPIKVDSTSNGEYCPRPLTRREVAANDHAQKLVGKVAGRLGISRRAFLKNAAGAAATLLAFNETHAKAGTSGGFFDIPDEAAYDAALAETVLGGDEFIFDIQTHCVDPSGAWRKGSEGKQWEHVLNRVFSQRRKCASDGFDCYSAEQLVKEVFLDSDTDVAVVSALWGARDSNPTPIEYAAEAQTIIDTLGDGKRALIHGGVLPNEPGALERMEVQAREFGVAAWKTYPQWGPQGTGYFMDDPEFGLPLIEKARELGVKVICAHRGIPLGDLDTRYSDPADIARVARRYPDVTFICYHAGWEPGVPEGPYAPEQDQGVDRLIRAHQEIGFKPNEGNLYAELGSTWRYHMSKPDEAAHLIGKLVKYFGDERICWGTDSLWYGSPQDQIQAFRTLQISQEW
ncbi:MAG: amidohydrolase family protein, partial [Pseudomonadota bacterium]|nr:amidohydrolase family protein [Pseudomonadota bacterium]